MSAKPRRRPEAFTIVELLVVITIIAILIAMLMPSLQASREVAKTTACMARVRGLATAAMAYANDFKNSCVPQVIYPTNFNYTPLASENRVMGTHRWAYWADALYPYLNYDDSAYGCPSGAVRLNRIPSPFGYAVTPFIYQLDNSGARISNIPFQVDDFRNAHEKIYFADSGYALANGGTPTAMHHFSPYLSVSRGSSSDNRASPATRHNSRPERLDITGSGPNVDCGFNAAYFDGHAGYRDWKATLPFTYAATNLAIRTYWLP